MDHVDDVIFLSVFAGMMALAFGYVRWCGRIVRSHRGEGREAR